MKRTRITAAYRHTLLAVVALLMFTAAFAQTEESKQNAEKIKLYLAGTFAKPKILPKLEKFALAQIRVNYKLSSTESVVGKEKSSGTMAGAKLAAYLETTDGKLTAEDFQGITNHFYHYFQGKLKAAGIDTVAWSTIANTEFYKDGDAEAEKADDDDPVMMTANANNGTVMYRGKTGFAFGKIKKASRFCEEVGAPAGFFNLTLDFANILLDVKIKTGERQNMYVIERTKSFKYDGTVIPQMIILPANFGSVRGSLLWNEKSGSESIGLIDNIEGDAAYSDKISQDVTRVKNNPFQFAKKLTPVVIETTRGKYIEAAKRSLEKFADAFIAKSRMLK